MQIRIGRIVLIALVIEVIGIALLVALVALLGPSEPEAARAYAEKLGAWVGPLAGFVLCLLGGLWVAKGLPAAWVLNGLVLGLVVAAIDIALLVASGSPFQPIFIASNVGRAVAGALGGWLASRSSRELA